jgi:hypothetical protein
MILLLRVSNPLVKDKAMERRFLRLKAMAEDLAISQRTMHHLVSVGCPCIQLRRLLWFDRQAVFAWLGQFERKAKRPSKKQLEEFAEVANDSAD